MTQAYIVTEGTTDELILRTLLPERAIRDVEFVVGKGSYSAQSLARTLLSVRNRPVALVIDADTNDTQTVNEKRIFLHQLFGPTNPMAKFEVFVAVPTIEGVLFHNKRIVERFLRRQLSDAEWKLAQNQPKKALESFVQGDASMIQTVLQRLSEEDIHNLQEHPLIHELTEFLTHIPQPINAP